MFWLYLPVATLGSLLAYPLVPLAVSLSDKEGRLPWLFQWLETHDAPGWEGPLTEPATRATTEKYGQKTGLIRWLWRNKAYRLRYWMKANVTEDMLRKEEGVSVPAKWGYSYWKGSIGPYWEFQPRFGFGKFHLYLRLGWKMKPYFDSPTWPKDNTSAGMYTGFSVRSDDWDDYQA
jgi:hypothetical protein